MANFFRFFLFSVKKESRALRCVFRTHECLRLLFTIGFLVDLSFSAVGMQFFFFLIEFWFADALFASHSSLEISTCGIKSDKPQNKLFQRKSISCEEKKIRHLRISSRLLMRFSKVFSRHFRSLLGMLIRHFKPSTHLPRILEYF